MSEIVVHWLLFELWVDLMLVVLDPRVAVLLIDLLLPGFELVLEPEQQ